MSNALWNRIWLDDVDEIVKGVEAALKSFAIKIHEQGRF